jgi:filamentous hemagglutinin
VFDPNKTDNPNPTLGSYLDADFRDSVQVTKQGMMRHVGEELAEKAAGAVAVGAAGVAAKKIYDARKALKIRAPSGFTGRFARMNPNDIRFSQNSAGGSGRAAQLRESMRNGWNGPAVDTVETVDGIVTIDNTCIAIARELGITEVPVKIRLPSDPLPDSMLGRFGDARTWGEALRFRTGNQRPPLPPTGTPNVPRLPN